MGRKPDSPTLCLKCLSNRSALSAVVMVSLAISKVLALRNIKLGAAGLHGKGLCLL